MTAEDHPRGGRPPIPIAPVDERAAAVVRARLERLAPQGGGLGRIGDVAAWLAAVTGSDRPALRARAFVAAADLGATPRGGAGFELRELAAGRRAASVLARELDVPLLLVDAGAAEPPGGEVVSLGLGPGRDLLREPALSVGEVAAAVDAGRELAAKAAREQVTVLAAGAIGAGAPVAATSLAALLTGREAAGRDEVAVALALHAPLTPGPLGALRRVGGGAIAVVCGLALGAGEHGLGLVCDGLAATAGAAVAAAIEPDLPPRLLAAEASGERTHVALLDQLGLEPVLAAGTGASGGGAAATTLALLRLGAALAAAES